MNRESFLGTWTIHSSSVPRILPAKATLRIAEPNGDNVGTDYRVQLEQRQEPKKPALLRAMRFDKSHGQMYGTLEHEGEVYFLFVGLCNQRTSGDARVIFGTLFRAPSDGAGEDGGATGAWAAEEGEGPGGSGG
ncbi:MAG: hypothetical protein AAGN66_19910 [Acidobacteriota bacterium]